MKNILPLGLLSVLLSTLSGCTYDSGYWGRPYGIGSIIILVLDIIAILDILRTNADLGWKVLWILLILLLPVVGLILYFLLGRKRSGGLD